MKRRNVLAALPAVTTGRARRHLHEGNRRIGNRGAARVGYAAGDRAGHDLGAATGCGEREETKQ